MTAAGLGGAGTTLGRMEDRWTRLVAPAVVTVLAVVGAARAGSGPAWSAALVVALVSALLGLRPLHGWPLLATLLTLAGLVSVICQADPGNVGWFGVCVLAGWAGYAAPWPRAAGLVVVATGMFVVQALVLSTESGWSAWIAGTAISGAGGANARRQLSLVRQLEQAQAGLAEKARAEERGRIAHELHDVVGHALTASLLHVSSARLALAEDPVEAEVSLAEAERLAQQSLAEVRAVVGLMRDPAGPAPLPGADQLEDLVVSWRRAGTTVDWRVDGDPGALTATEGLTVYRILQEALTNAARHAAGAAVAAHLELLADRTRLVVDSAGRPALTPLRGVGLDGMRARAVALGGELSAGPHHGGWRVEAMLPRAVVGSS